MSELISGKDVVLALLENKSILYKKLDWEDDEKEDVLKHQWTLEELETGRTVGGETVEFYLKPRTIKLNGIDVPRPEKATAAYSSNGSVVIVMDTNEDAEKFATALRSVFNENN